MLTTVMLSCSAGNKQHTLPQLWLGTLGDTSPQCKRLFLLTKDRKLAFSQLEHVVGSAEVPEEHPHGPAICHRVVQGEDQHVLLLLPCCLPLRLDWDEACMDHGPAGHRKGPRYRLLQRIRHLLLFHSGRLQQFDLQKAATSESVTVRGNAVSSTMWWQKAASGCQQGSSAGYKADCVVCHWHLAGRSGS